MYQNVHRVFHLSVHWWVLFKTWRLQNTVYTLQSVCVCVGWFWFLMFVFVMQFVLFIYLYDCDLMGAVVVRDGILWDVRTMYGWFDLQKSKIIINKKTDAKTDYTANERPLYTTSQRQSQSPFKSKNTNNKNQHQKVKLKYLFEYI